MSYHGTDGKKILRGPLASRRPERPQNPIPRDEPEMTGNGQIRPQSIFYPSSNQPPRPIHLSGHEPACTACCFTKNSRIWGCLAWVKKCCHIWLDQNFEPSLLTNKLWLIFMGKKQKKNFYEKKNSKWPTQEKYIFQNRQFSKNFCENFMDRSLG